MKNIAFLITSIAIISCVDKSVPVTTTSIINNSGHSIEYRVKVTTDTSLYLMFFIENNKKIEVDFGGGLGSATEARIYPLSMDSVLVTYANKASIWHTTDINSPVSKSIVLESSYEGGKVNDGLYEYSYTFTPADYEEALKFGD